MKIHCENCRYWSDMVATADSNGLKAICLNTESPYSQKYMRGIARCVHAKPSYGFAIDDRDVGSDFHAIRDRRDL